jgi:16S rRNA processing protein RimM
VVEPAPELPGGDGIVFVLSEARRIVRRAGTSEKPILRLEGSSSRDDALALRGHELTIPRSEDMLEEGEFWARDLEGCTVVSGDVVVGFVRRMSALPSVEVLEVDRADGSELLVPLVRDCIRSIDIEARRIDIDLSFLGER